MRYVVIENNKVVNVVLSDTPLAENWIKSDTAHIGWTYLNDEFLPPELPKLSTDPNDYELTAIQFEKALVLLDVDRFTIPDTLKSLYTDGIITKEVYADYLSRWLQLTSIKRSSDVLKILKPKYNKTDAEIDAAWLKAAGVTGD
jgi:hypothetical protein